MTEPDPKNRGFYWSVLFFRQLIQLGVTHAVISPGSRSTPLTLAAASHSGLKKQVILDERSAAYVALGIGKATGIPPVLICTSGTAVANYFPAVIESRMSGVPLILATADRPPHLRGTGANQAIDQLRIFGDYPVLFHEVGEPCFEKEDISRLILLADQSVEAAINLKGPVHLNFPFRKPLEPEASCVATVEKENSELNKTDGPGTVIVRPAPLSVPSQAAGLIKGAKRPLIISGPLSRLTSAKTVETLAEKIKAPIISEGGFSSDNAIMGVEGFLRQEDNLKNLRPDLILRFGFQPTGKAVELAMKTWADIPHVHFASSGSWHDATFSTTHRVSWQESPVEWKVEPGITSDWLSRWKSTENEFFTRTDRLLSQASALTDLHIYHYLTPEIPEQWNVFLSNSFPVRDSLMTGRYRTPNVFVNRGASGIDGITSTAMGVNLALDQPTVLFTGDLAFLHDTNALLNSQLLNQPLIIVVINNDGGNVFRMLPIFEHDDYYREYFETPQSADLSSMANTYGLSYSCVDSKKILQDIDLAEVARATGKGISIIECKTDSEASMNLRNKLWYDTHAS